MEIDYRELQKAVEYLADLLERHEKNYFSVHVGIAKYSKYYNVSIDKVDDFHEAN